MDTEFISITHEKHHFKECFFDLIFSLMIYTDAVSSIVAAVERK